MWAGERGTASEEAGCEGAWKEMERREWGRTKREEVGSDRGAGRKREGSRGQRVREKGAGSKREGSRGQGAWGDERDGEQVVEGGQGGRVAQ